MTPTLARFASTHERVGRIHRFTIGLVASAMMGLPADASAAELTVLVSNGIKTVVEELIPVFEKATGHTVHVTFDLTARLRERVESGAGYDVAIVTPQVVDAAIARGTIARDSRSVLARSPLAIFQRSGRPKADISTVAAFTRFLREAPSLSYTSQGVSGVYFAGLLEKLGVADVARPKTLLAPGAADVGEIVASGKAAYGVLPVSEILPVRGTEVLGPLPAEVQSYIVMVAGVGAATKERAAARAFVDFLASPSQAAVLKRHGMERDQ
jgi:molybdate transport system substrate-binding protein